MWTIVATAHRKLVFKLNKPYSLTDLGRRKCHSCSNLSNFMQCFSEIDQILFEITHEVYFNSDMLKRKVKHQDASNEPFIQESNNCSLFFLADLLSVTRKRHLFQECSVSRNQERIQDFCHSGGSKGDSTALPPSPTNQNCLNFLGGKLGSHMLVPPFGGLAPPPMGYPGSTPVSGGGYVIPRPRPPPNEN